MEGLSAFRSAFLAPLLGASAPSSHPSSSPEGSEDLMAALMDGKRPTSTAALAALQVDVPGWWLEDGVTRRREETSIEVEAVRRDAAAAGATEMKEEDMLAAVLKQSMEETSGGSGDGSGMEEWSPDSVANRIQWLMARPHFLSPGQPPYLPLARGAAQSLPQRPAAGCGRIQVIPVP